MANDLPYDSYGSSGPQSYQSDTFQPVTQLGQPQPQPTPASQGSPVSPPPPTDPYQVSSMPPMQNPSIGETTTKPDTIAGSLAKEQLESAPSNYSETVPIVETTSEHEKVPEAVEGWLEKLERQEDVKLDQPITDDQNQPVLQNSTPQISEDQIILPLEETDISEGIKHKPTSSIRWLAEWCMRLIKKFPGKVFYAS